MPYKLVYANKKSVAMTEVCSNMNITKTVSACICIKSMTTIPHGQFVINDIVWFGFLFTSLESCRKSPTTHTAERVGFETDLQIIPAFQYSNFDHCPIFIHISMLHYKHHVELKLEVSNDLLFRHVVYARNQPIFMMTSSNGNLFPVTDPLCGEFTGHRCIPLTKASDALMSSMIWAWANGWVNN